VGSSPCTHATVSSAITAASSGDKLLIEGGVTFYENITVGKNLTLQGGYNGCGSGSSTATTLNGSASGTVAVVNAGLTVTLEKLVLTNGSYGDAGGGIRFAVGGGGGQLTLTNVDIHSNTAKLGGGVWAGLNSLVVGTNVNIYNNIATGYGGGVRLYAGGSATFSNSNINGNSAPYGAGFYINNATSVLNFSGNINNNNASANGGAIYASAGDLNFSNTTMQNNSAQLDGGAIYQTGGAIDFTGSWSLDNNSANVNGGALALSGDGLAHFFADGGTGSLINNQAGGDGGAVYLHNNSEMELRAVNGYNLNVLDNQAGGDGGAFFADGGGFFDVYGQVVISGNSASGNGGAYYLANGSRVWFDDYAKTVPKILTNWAQNGGAVYAVNSPNVRCDGAEFGDTPVGNYATAGSGGAIYLSSSTLNAENCKFYNNKATLHGGAVAAVGSSTLTIHANLSTGDPLSGECSSLNNNIADSDNDDNGSGGAIYTSDSTLELTQTYLHHNSARSGGAIYQTGAGASADVSNCLIHHNTVSTALGAGIRCKSGAFKITHTTIADNIGGSGFSGVASEAVNCIAWGNTASGFSLVPTVHGCNIDDGGRAGDNVDPKFTAPGSGENYHLRGTSPAIDACATCGLTTDLENRTRPNGAGFEMGAYEYYPVAALPFIPLLLLGD
jgi:hypothetical protein